jgi:hypothetical protein
LSATAAVDFIISADDAYLEAALLASFLEAQPRADMFRSKPK